MTTIATRTLAELPTPSGGLPLLGHVRGMADSTQIHRTFERWADEVGEPMFLLRNIGVPLLCVADHALITDVLKARPDAFRRWSRQEQLLAELSSYTSGVFTAEGDAWRRQRKLVNAALNMRHLQRYYGTILTSGLRLHRQLEAAADGRPFDITRLFYRYTVDTTSALALGHDLNTLEQGEAPLQRGIELLLQTLMRRFFAPIPYWRWLPRRSDREVREAMDVAEETFREYLARGRTRVEQNPGLLDDPENAIDAMLAEQQRDPSLTDADIISNIIVLITAGEDTTANTLGWTTWFLATRPELQERIAAEADDAFGDARFPEDVDAIDRLTFTDAVLRESMRLRSVGPVLGAEALVDTTVGDVAVPAGTLLMLFLRKAAHGDDADADAFRPDRWLEGEPPPRTLGFGGGPRFCPGRNLALTEARAGLAMLCRDFAFTLDETSPVREELHFTLVPKGLRIRLRPRR